MRLYETAFLIAPNLPEEETEKFIQEMEGVVKKKKGKMVNVDKWGKRKLAYEIQKFDAAFYVFFTYEGESDIQMELERRFKQSEAILRYLTVTKDEKVKLRKKRVRRKPKEPVGPPRMEDRQEEVEEVRFEEPPEVSIEEPPAPETEPAAADEIINTEKAKEEEK